MPLGREDVKRVRRKLRWFTFIVVILAGVNSYLNGSLAESGGINVTGLGGAFATAFFIFLAVLIFISIPFNVLAFFVAHINRYPLQAFRKVNRVLTWLTVLFSLLLGIYCYFSGIIAGGLRVTGLGGAIYAIILMMLVMIAVVVIPVNVVAFLVFAIRGPSENPDRVKDHRPHRWTNKYQEAVRQQRANPTQYLFVGQGQFDWKERASQFLQKADKYSLAASFFLILTSGFVPEGEAREMALKLSEDCFFKAARAFKAFRDIGKFVNHSILHKPAQAETQEDRQLEAFRKSLAAVYNIRHANQKQN